MFHMHDSGFVEPRTGAAPSMLSTMSVFSPSSPARTGGLTNEQILPLPRKQEIASPTVAHTLPSLQRDCFLRGRSICDCYRSWSADTCYVGGDRSIKRAFAPIACGGSMSDARVRFKHLTSRMLQPPSKPLCSY